MNSLEGNKLTSKGVSLLFKLLGESALIIREIHLNSNKIDDNCFDAFGEFIMKNKYILSIDLSDNLIGDKGIDILAPYFAGNTTFKCLSLNRNEEIGDKSYNSIANMIKGSHIFNIDLTRVWMKKINNLAVLLAHNQLAYGSETLDLSNK